MMEGDSAATRSSARDRTAPSSPIRTKFINLALQGGGAHGAFTWGVLDQLLDDERIAFDGVSATSAGAMNAAVFACGLAAGGREGAKRALAGFWRRVSHAASLGPLQPTVFDRILGDKALAHSPIFAAFDLMSRLFSPYEFNPLNLNPLRDVLLDSVDFAALDRKTCPIKLFLAATNVRTGKVRVFENPDITVDAVLASACLPALFQAVEIDGEAYWDGGYMGNPPIFPLIYNCTSNDVLIVHINPLRRDKLPRSATEILNRINEISFNSSLMREMRAVNFVTKLIDDARVPEGTFRRMLVHALAADDVMSKLGVASKLNADWEFLLKLHETGREQAKQFLAAHFDQLGTQSTVDLPAVYM